MDITAFFITIEEVKGVRNVHWTIRFLHADRKRIISVSVTMVI